MNIEKNNNSDTAMKADRIDYIDIAKCIGMVLVIHNHLGLNYGNNIIKIIIASFHMPLFFILSGLTRPNYDNKFRDYLLKRFATIVIPYYLWSFIFSDFNLKSFIYIIYGSNRSINIAGGVGGSWFLPCYFLSDIIFEGTRRLYKNNKLAQIITMLSLFCFGWILSNFKPSIGYFMSFDVALCGAGFITIAYMIKEIGFLKIVNTLQKYKKMIIALLLLGISSAIAIINRSSYNNEYNRAVMALGYYGNYVLFTLSGFLGAFSVVFFSAAIAKIRASNIMQRIGKNTLSILLVQQVCIIYCEKISSRFAFLLNPIGAVCLSVIILIISHFIAEIITFVAPNLKGKYLFLR